MISWAEQHARDLPCRLRGQIWYDGHQEIDCILRACEHQVGVLRSCEAPNLIALDRTRTEVKARIARAIREST